MRIIYIANARIPTEKAHGIQIMKMCESFAFNNELELVLPMRSNKVKADPFAYYGMKAAFKITKLPCLDLIPFCRYLGNLGLWVESLTFFFPTFFYAIFKKADLIYTRNKFILPLALFKKNLIYEAHTFPNNYFLYSFFFKKTKGIVTITQNLKTLFLEKGISQDKLLVAPDGVDIDMFNIDISRAEARQKLGLDPEENIILYTGHLYKWKGVDTLIASADILLQGSKIYLVGGTQKDLIRLDCRKNNVKIAGHRPYAEIPLWLKAADVLVLPNSGKEKISRSWTSPMKVFEYMAAHRPIVASNLPSIREVLNDRNAFLVEPDDVQGLAQGISRALAQRNLALEVADRAFAEVQNYTWRKRVQRIYDYFKLDQK